MKVQLFHLAKKVAHNYITLVLFFIKKMSHDMTLCFYRLVFLQAHIATQ